MFTNEKDRPMPSQSPDLVATYWTIAGDVLPLSSPAQEASPIDFRTRVEAAQRPVSAVSGSCILIS